MDLWSYFDEIVKKKYKTESNEYIVLSAEMDPLETFKKYFLIDADAWYRGIYLLPLLHNNNNLATESKVDSLLHLPKLVEQWVFL